MKSVVLLGDMIMSINQDVDQDVVEVAIFQMNGYKLVSPPVM